MHGRRTAAVSLFLSLCDRICPENGDLYNLSQLKAEQDFSPVCSVLFSLMFFSSLHSLYYRVYQWPQQLCDYLLVRVSILCSLLYFRPVYPGLISKGESFLTAAQFYFFLKPFPTSLSTKKSPPGIYTEKIETYFIKKSKGMICCLWSTYFELIGKAVFSILTCSTFPYLSNSFLSSGKFAFLLRWWPMASRYSREIIDEADSKLGIITDSRFHFTFGTVCHASLFWDKGVTSEVKYLNWAWESVPAMGGALRTSACVVVLSFGSIYVSNLPFVAIIVNDCGNHFRLSDSATISVGLSGSLRSHDANWPVASTAPSITPKLRLQYALHHDSNKILYYSFLFLEPSLVYWPLSRYIASVTCGEKGKFVPNF